MSAGMVTVTGRGTGDVDYRGHGNSAVAIPGRVTGDVVVSWLRTVTGVNLVHGPRAVPSSGLYIGTGKFPRRVTCTAAVSGIGILTAAVRGTLPLLLRSLGTSPLIFGSLGRNRYLYDPWAGYRGHYVPCAL